MIRQPVESSSIKSIGYDPQSAVLEMEFNSGAVYQYQGFNQLSYDLLMAAGSKGVHFSTHIRACFVGHRVHEPNCQTNSDCWCHRQRKDVTEEKNRAAKVEEVESKSVKASKARPAKRRQAI